jgi:glycosyltransferase involved in cell wall biosynthesis
MVGLCDCADAPRYTDRLFSRRLSLARPALLPSLLICADMNILLIHQNFPGQFLHLAPALAQQGHTVVALGTRQQVPDLPGVRYVRHHPIAPATATPHDTGPMAHLMQGMQAKLARADSAARAMAALQTKGFTPDVVFVHSGWGEALFVKAVFPRARLLVYAEYFYGAEGGDSGFDPEFSHENLQSRQKTLFNNLHLMQALQVCDAAVSPMAFQRSQHPQLFQSKISVIHEGIDTQRFVPNPAAWVQLGSMGQRLKAGDEVVTFVARQLEPYRGYHTFMRALPLLLKARPQARVVIVGDDGVSYGAAPPGGGSWKQVFLDEVKAALGPDLARVHFVGRLPHEVLTQLLQVSAVHVYLTYPFVLSWSLLEAMSMGCLVVGSDTAPVREVIRDGHNGLLTDFFDPPALALKVAQVLEKKQDFQHLRAVARQTVVNGFDLKQVCLPQALRFVAEAGVVT